METSANDPRINRAAEAMVAGDYPVAESILRNVLGERPNDAIALRMLGEIAATFGVLRDAEALHRRALAAAPGFDFARLHLAIVLHDQSRAGEALAELDQISGELLAYNATKSLKASALARVGEHDAAIAIYREIVGSQPEDIEAWTNLAFLLKTIGRTEEAAETLRRVLEIAPTHGEAWWMLADMKTLVFSAEDIAAMQRVLVNADLSDDDRVGVHFALGKALEDCADVDSSFDQYRAANAIRSGQLRHDPSRITELVDRTERLFTSEFLSSRAGAGDPAPDPIFIVGLPRSGSTLVEQILASHPMIEGTGELSDIYLLARSLEADSRFAADWHDYPQLLADEPSASLTDLGRLYLDRTRVQRKTDRPLFIDKMPNNWLHTGFIHLILPNAKIIDVRRHPIACGFSNFKQLYSRGQEFSYDFGHFAAHYREYVRLMGHFDRVAPGLVHRVVHDRLVMNPEDEIRALLAFVGVPFDDRCLTSHLTERPVRTPSAEQVRRPIRREAANEWRAFDSHLGQLKQALGSLVEAWDSPAG